MNLAFKKLQDKFGKKPKPTVVLIIVFFVIYSLLVSLVLIKYLNLSDKIYASMNYGLGELVTSLVQNGKYQVCHDYCLGAHRYPLIPLFIYGLTFFTKNLSFILIVKSLLVGMALSYVVIRLLRSKTGLLSWLLLGLVFITPQFVLHAFNIDYEEAYVIALLAVLCSMLFLLTSDKPSRQQGLFFGLVNMLLFITKSSIIYLCFALPLLYYFKYRDFKMLFTQYGLLLLIALSLAGFNFSNSGKFTLSSSYNGWNIYKGNNQYTLEYYPKYGLDLLDYKGLTAPKIEINNEWSLNDYYVQEAKSFIKNHPLIFVKSVFIKAHALFLEVRPFGLAEEEIRYDSWLKYVGTGFMILHRLLFVASLFFAFRYIFSRASHEQKISSMVFLSIIGFYSLPFLVGFGYERHYMPLLLPVAFFAINVLNWQKEKSLNSL